MHGWTHRPNSELKGVGLDALVADNAASACGALATVRVAPPSAYHDRRRDPVRPHLGGMALLSRAVAILSRRSAKRTRILNVYGSMLMMSPTCLVDETLGSD